MVHWVEYLTKVFFYHWLWPLSTLILFSLRFIGVGQSESDITKLADLSILTLAPGLGDSIQAMKGGVLNSRFNLS